MQGKCCRSANADDAVDAGRLLLRKLLSPESKTVDHVLRLLAVEILVITFVGVESVHQVRMRHIIGNHVRIVTTVRAHEGPDKTILLATIQNVVSTARCNFSD